MPDTDRHRIDDQDLVFHILNVGRGDTIVIEFPVDADGYRSYGVVDCYRFDKLARYLDALRERRPGHQRLEFLCATHPHGDHILGIPKMIESPRFRPREFWDSGFRHSSQTYRRILHSLHRHKVRLVRVSSGMEWYFGRVRITALAPSVILRNRYGTYGVDINNASVVLRVEHHKGDTILNQSLRYEGTQEPEQLRHASPSTVILAGDAEFDSWARINEEFPVSETTSRHKPNVRKMMNLLNCSVLKVAHHGSMHSIPLDVLERMRPALAIIPTEQQQGTTDQGKPNELTRTLFPHPAMVAALKETCQEVLSTDGSFDWPRAAPAGGEFNPGSVIFAVPSGGRPRWRKLGDTREENARVVDSV